MTHAIGIYEPQSMSVSDLTCMFRLRYEVFHTRLGWDVSAIDGMERDEFDELPSVEYVLAKSPSGEIDACWRILPTIGPYMLKNTFPELLHGQEAPQADDCWELSRFAVATNRTLTANASFGPISVGLMRESARFAKNNGIVRYVTVTTPVMERMLRQQGIHIHRIGPSIRIGKASAVALIIEIDDITLNAIEYAD